MYQICICDDEQAVLLLLKDKINKEFERLGIAVNDTLIQDSRVLMEQLGQNDIDILFLDIDMPYHNGMDIAGYINEHKLDIILAFVTSHEALVYKTFAYRPFAFIRKTYLDEDLMEFSSRIAKELEQRKSELILTRGTELCRIRINDIVYMESEGNYMNIITIDHTFRFRETMTYMENELTPKGFMRCHKGYLVNPDYIEKYKGNSLEIKGAENGVQEIPVGRSYEKEVKHKIIASIR